MIRYALLLAALSLASLVRADEQFHATLIYQGSPEVIQGTASLTLEEMLLRWLVTFDSDGINSYQAAIELATDSIDLPITSSGVSFHDFDLEHPEWSFPGRTFFAGETMLSEDQSEQLRSGQGEFTFGGWRGTINAVPEPTTGILAMIAVHAVIWIWHYRRRLAPQS